MPLYFYLPPVVTYFFTVQTLIEGRFSGKCMVGTSYESLILSSNFELFALMIGMIHLMVMVMTRRSIVGILLGMVLNLGIAAVVMRAC